MPIHVSDRAIAVLSRALEAGRMDPKTVGIRLSLGPSGDLRTGFADAPEAGDHVIDAGALRLFLPAELASAEVSIDVSSEHDQIVLGPPAEDRT